MCMETTTTTTTATTATTTTTTSLPSNYAGQTKVLEAKAT